MRRRGPHAPAEWKGVVDGGDRSRNHLCLEMVHYSAGEMVRGSGKWSIWIGELLILTAEWSVYDWNVVHFPMENNSFPQKSGLSEPGNIVSCS